MPAGDAAPSGHDLPVADDRYLDRSLENTMSYLATFVLRGPGHSLDGAGLHDATLADVAMDWQRGEVKLSVLLVNTIPATLAFHQVTSASLPRVQPWGPSTSINEAKALSDGTYAIEMQSGDILQFCAASWSLSIRAVPSEA